MFIETEVKDSKTTYGLKYWNTVASQECQIPAGKTLNMLLLTTAGGRNQFLKRANKEEDAKVWYKKWWNKVKTFFGYGEEHATNLENLQSKIRTKIEGLGWQLGDFLPVIISGRYEGLFAWLTLEEKLKDTKFQTELCETNDPTEVENCKKSTVFVEVGGASV